MKVKTCNHPRQHRLPCASPQCKFSTEESKISGKVITRQGLAAGWRYDSKEIPEHFLGEVEWCRVSAPIVSGSGDVGHCHFWLPGLSDSGPRVSFRQCFDSWTAMYCPQDGNFLGKTKIYRKGLSVLVGCRECGHRYRPIYHSKDGTIEWVIARGKSVGSNNAIPIMEYPE